jgi:hypothetical protein
VKTNYAMLLAAVALPLCLFAQSAAAADTTPAEREAARQLVAEGETRTVANDLKGAVESYQRANDIMHVPSTGIELARALERVGRLVEARDIALEVIRHAPAPGESKVFAVARTEAATMAAALQPRLGSLEIVGFAADVAVTLDGRPVSAASRGLRTPVDPGEHTVTATQDFCTPFTQKVKIAEGQSLKVGEALKCDLNAAKTTAAEQARAVKLAEEKEKARLAALQPPPAKTSPAVYAAYGIGGAGLGLGIVTGIMSLSKTSDGKVGCVNGLCPVGNEPDRKSANTLAWVSNVGFLVGVTGAVVGTVALLSGKTPAPVKAGAIKPSVDVAANGAGANVTIVWQ